LASRNQSRIDSDTALQHPYYILLVLNSLITNLLTTKSKEAG